MGNTNLVPYETIVRATNGEPECINLSVSGELSEIADSINKASNIISRQNTARANWISGISHDIRTPLSMIMGYADRIVNDKDASNQMKEQAAVISRQSIKIKDLVQDLNLVSKLEYEMQPLQKENIRLSKLLRSYAIDLINSGLSESYSLEVNISPDSENSMIECDTKLITRAVNNLVQNSIHSNPKGCTIFLSLQITESKLLLTVQDNGIGISAEKLKYIIPHQANARIVEIISRKTKIPLEKFYMNISEYSNTSAATIPIALNEMVQKGLLQKGDYILMAGFGGGLTWGGLLIKI